MRRAGRIIRSMDGPIRVLGHLTRELRMELDKTTRDLQEEFPIVETGVKDALRGKVLLDDCDIRPR